MDLNARLPTGDIAADPHSILASRSTCSCSGSCAYAEHLDLSSWRQASLLLGRPQPVPWVQLVTRCWWLSSLDPTQIPLVLWRPVSNCPLAISTGYDTGPSKLACPKPTLSSSPCPDSPLLHRSPTVGKWYHLLSNHPSQNPKKNSWSLLLLHSTSLAYSTS